MRSLTERALRARRALELGCRVAALALLGWALLAALRTGDGADARPRAVRGDALARELAALTLEREAGPLHVELPGAPAAAERAWLRALARSGRAVSWSGEAPPTALGVDPVAEPTGGVVISAAGPSGSVLRLLDEAGTIDSARVRHGGIEVRVPALEGRARVTAGATTATSALPDSLALRDVVVLGRPSWETRFVTAALEEAGWRVALRTPLAPGQVVQQGSVALDTARVGAVVALDSSASSVAETVGRFVRAGGGLIVTAAAARDVSALAALAAGANGPLEAPSLADAGDSLTRGDLPLVPITAMRPDAVVLERRDRSVALAARRVGAGRVAQVGYADSWRWRLSGGDSGVVAHRRWWSALVASVAHAPAHPRADTSAEADPAPLAATVDALGAARPRPEDAARAAATLPTPVLFALIVLLLLAEWLSRRLRGAR